MKFYEINCKLAILILTCQNFGYGAVADFQIAADVAGPQMSVENVKKSRPARLLT